MRWIVCVLGVLLLASCSSLTGNVVRQSSLGAAFQESPQGAVVVVVLAPLSGPDASMGIQARAGVEVAFDALVDEGMDPFRFDVVFIDVPCSQRAMLDAARVVS
ncbi:MAG: hypothetical protein ABIH41_03070, partial [Nanoarchaeota archaeon]